MNFREFLFGVLMGTVGALGATVHYERQVTNLRVQTEESYHEGEGDGYATAWYQFTGKPRKIQEDQAGWDCHTMGNRKCGTTAQARK